VSRSEQTSLRLYNGRNKYNEWAFVATDATTQAGGGGVGTQQPGGVGTQQPGMEGRGRGLQAPGMGGRGLPQGSGNAPLQLPGGGGRRGGSPFDAR
jgi:hypothetical protein